MNPDGAAAAREPRLIRSGSVMAAGTLVSRALGLVRQAMLTACVGAPLVGSAFQVANTLPNYVYQLLAGGLLNAILLPQIVAAMRRPDRGRAFIDRLLTAAIGAVLVVTVAVTVCARPLIRLLADFDPQVEDLATFFALVCLPQVLGYGLYTILGQVLNARGRFGAFMWAPVLANVVQIAGMAIFLHRYVFQPAVTMWNPQMVWWLAGTMTAGIWVQGLVLAVALLRDGFPWRPRLDLRGHGLWAASKIAGWAFVALAVAQGGGLFVQWALTRVETESGGGHIANVYLYQVAFLIFMLPHSIVSTSILTALFPRIAVAARDDDLAAQRVHVTTGLTMPALGIIPMTVAAVALAGPVVAVVQPGLVEWQVAATASMLAVMAVGLLPFGITVLAQRYLFAYGEGRTNLWFQLVITGFAVLSGLVALAVPVRLGGVVVAAGMTVGEWSAAVAFLLLVRRRLGLALRRIGGLYLRLAAAGVVGAAAALVTRWTLSGRLSDGYLAQVLVLAGGTGAFVGGFVVSAVALRLRELAELWRALRPSPPRTP